MKRCKFENVAVCKSIEERNVFSHILKKLHPPIQICDKALYEITNPNGDTFLIKDFERVKGGDNKECFITDIYTGKIIILNQSNFSVVCPLLGERCECSEEEFVLEYQIARKPK